MEEKYIELLINKCTDLKNNKVLFLSYNKEIKPFINKLIEYCHQKGIEEIYQDEEDKYQTHKLLKEMTEEEIATSPFFNKKIWDEYAQKKTSFLMFETEIPHLMDDIDPKKLALAAKTKRNTKPLYRHLQEKCQLSWCIAAYPNKSWAENIFPNSKNPLEELKKHIFKMCLVDTENPTKEWDKVLNKNQKIINKLNQLDIDKLIYKNSLGTNLTIYLPKNYLYSSAKDPKAIVNMPSYEVFTSPIYNKTEGIVYSSKPLIYNGGLIDNFYIKFKNGRAIEYDAQVGKEILKEIIETDSNSCYLGEAALVEKDSPIAQMNINFQTTLIDENASCHLALGSGFAECLKNGITLTNEELQSRGVNISKQHVDFMIGTNDLNITAITHSKEEIPIFKDGKFTKELL